MGNVVTLSKAVEICDIWRRRENVAVTIAFTNGCFDLFHVGHLQTILFARSKATQLIVGVNSDESVERVKGIRHPIIPFEQRAKIVAAIAGVSLVVKFEEDTPAGAILALRPDVLVKGGEYDTKNIVGSTVVTAGGGTVQTCAMVPGISTTKIIERIRRLYDHQGDI